MGKNLRQTWWEAIEIPGETSTHLLALITMVVHETGTTKAGPHTGAVNPSAGWNLISSQCESLKILFLHPFFHRKMDKVEVLKREPRDPC